MHGCSQKSQCSTIAHIHPQGICSFCCDTELCNRNCTIKSTVASPPSTSTTTTTMAPSTPIPLTAPIITQTIIRPTNIKYGDTVTIQCIATGNPKPTIGFLVKGRRLGANVHLDPTTHLLTISHFLPYDDGVYRCIAANLLGDVHKDIHIQGHT
ncbi:leucine-rich repeats and immunoglobulin-like domains protein 1 [Mytilus galloprovincialis]|uniref:leucine-rich repeats and immunoglobulin-like domains protein 1 n=1 Tax=Mytilus galloprovincialis TaxID=29158 RepID=UPI003F7B79E8